MWWEGWHKGTMRILLADDSKAMRILFREVFQKLGHSSADILESADWRGSLAALRAGPAFDLLVYDWELPGMDGSDLMWALKELGPAGKVMVLFSVPRLQRHLVAHSARQGPCDFIEKPFTPEGFQAKVRGLGSSFEAKARESSRQIKAVKGPEAQAGARFLSQLPENVREDLIKLATPTFHEAGSTLLRAGEVCGALRFITEGEAEILQGAAGRVARVVEQGDPFGELSFMTLQPSAETVRARTRVETASLSKKTLSDLLRKQPAMAIHLSALMGRHQKTMTARATTLEHSDFKGTFDTMPFADVMQMLMATKKTGILGVRSDSDRGAIYLVHGEAMHAWTDELKGETAFFAVAGWGKAKFAFTSIERDEPRTLMEPTITLLMKAMRRLEQKASR
ncbi:MAG TPA: DUF4388 domain-containing protein [Planctomycetota bacterium]